MNRDIEHQRKDELAERHRAEQRAAEQAIDDGELDFDKRLVLKPKRQRPEHQDHDGRHNRHDGHPSRPRPGNDHRDQDGDHQDRRRRQHAHFVRGKAFGQDRPHKPVEQRRSRVGDKEQRQRPELEQQLDDRVRRLARGASGRLGSIRPRHCTASVRSTPAIASAKSRAANGSRSSIPSPTPM